MSSLNIHQGAKFNHTFSKVIKILKELDKRVYNDVTLVGELQELLMVGYIFRIGALDIIDHSNINIKNNKVIVSKNIFSFKSYSVENAMKEVYFMINKLSHHSTEVSEALHSILIKSDGFFEYDRMIGQDLKSDLYKQYT